MSIVLTLTLAVAATPGLPPLGRSHRHAVPYRGPELYSLAARRRFQSYLRLRLLQMRLEGLDRAREVIEHRLELDSLLPRIREVPPSASAKPVQEIFHPADEEPANRR